MQTRSVARLRTSVVPVFARRLRGIGHDPAPSLVANGLSISAEHESDVEVPLASVITFGEACAERSEDRAFGVHTALALPRGTFGLVEYSARCAPNVRGALERLVRYFVLINDGAACELDLGATRACFRYAIPGAATGLGVQGNEFAATAILSIGAQLCTAFRPRRVFHAHADDRSRQVLQTLYPDASIEFGAGATGFELDAALLEAPVLSSEPPLLALLDRQAEQSAADRPRRTEFVSQLERVLREQLAAGNTELHRVAPLLEMSARTLQRRLSEAGTSFDGVLESLRQNLSAEWLSETKRPVGEVAYLLGYSDVSAFVRAHKRWTGRTPAQVRSDAARAVASTAK